MAVALLAEEGRLSLDDSVSEHLDGYPDWAEPVTLTQLIHHTSGIPDIEGLMQAEGVWFEMEATRTGHGRRCVRRQRLRARDHDHSRQRALARR